jgi:hypothetical protein
MESCYAAARRLHQSNLYHVKPNRWLIDNSRRFDYKHGSKLCRANGPVPCPY